MPARTVGLEDLAAAEANATLTRILGAIEEYVYTGEFLPDDSYRLLFAGPCRERLLGMSVEAARTAVWADYVHPDWIEVFDAAHYGAHQTGRLDVEISSSAPTAACAGCATAAACARRTGAASSMARSSMSP